MSTKVSNVRWVTDDGVPASAVTVTIASLLRSGTAKILGISVSLNAVGRKSGRGTGSIAATAVLSATASRRKTSMASTVRWVTDDGVAAPAVSVTVVGTDHFGSGSLASPASLGSTGRKGGIGAGRDITFYATLTTTGVPGVRVPGGSGTLALTAVLVATGSAGRAVFGRPIVPIVAFVAVGTKAAGGTGSAALAAPTFTARGTSVGGTPNAPLSIELSGGFGEGLLFVRRERTVSWRIEGGGDPGPVYDQVTLSVAMFRLVWSGQVDDHRRPHHRLWNRFLYPTTQTALLLWMDGTVREIRDIDLATYYSADDVIAGGHEWQAPEGAWQLAVLQAAGYTIEPV